MVVMETEGEPDSRGKTLPKGDQQLRRSLDAYTAAQQQGPQQASLFRQEAQPRLAVGGHTHVGLALMTILDLQGAVPDRDRRLFLLRAGERKMVDGVQLRRFPWLKRETQPRQESLNR